jgi:hypothetical protein
MRMEYLIGLVLAFVVAGLAAVVGFDRDRSSYPTVLIVIASYYVLFAVIGGSARTLWVEILIASGFLLVAVLGFKTNESVAHSRCYGRPWIVRLHPSFVY